MTGSDKSRSDLIESYTQAHQNLVAMLIRCPRIMWDYKPGPTQWSIREILIHLADSETHAYIRCRRIIAEPGQAVIAFDQDAWASQLNYADQDPDDALEFFRLARKQTVRLLRLLPEEAWARTMIHPEAGVVSLDQWLAIFARHAEAHIQQIQRVHRSWQGQQQQQIPVNIAEYQQAAQQQ